jgi:hypothetical protein
MTEVERFESSVSAQPGSAGERPLPRRKLGLGAVALLFILRIYVLVAVPLIGYAFFKAL